MSQAYKLYSLINQLLDAFKCRMKDREGGIQKAYNRLDSTHPGSDTAFIVWSLPA